MICSKIIIVLQYLIIYVWYGSFWSWTHEYWKWQNIPQPYIANMTNLLHFKVKSVEMESLLLDFIKWSIWSIWDPRPNPTAGSTTTIALMWKALHIVTWKSEVKHFLYVKPRATTGYPQSTAPVLQYQSAQVTNLSDCNMDNFFGILSLGIGSFVDWILK